MFGSPLENRTRVGVDNNRHGLNCLHAYRPRHGKPVRLPKSKPAVAWPNGQGTHAALEPPGLSGMMKQTNLPSMNTRDKTPLQPIPPITDAVTAEVLRRRATFERDKRTARPWPEILAEQRRKVVGPR